MAKTHKRVDLLQGSILGALTKLALPLMGTSLIQMAYNLTDMAWIGRLGAGPVASVGVAGIYMWLATGIVMLARVGGQVRVANHIGAGDISLAADYAQAAVQLGVAISAVLGMIFVLFTQPLIAFFGLSGVQAIADAEIYLRIVGTGLIFTSFVQVLTAIITTTGNSHTPFVATAIGLVVNIVLDPVLIFGLYGFPKLGVMGAALATVAAQAVVALLFVLYIINDTHLFCHVHFFKAPKPAQLKDILKLSAPAALQNILFPSITMLLSRFVAAFGDNAIAVQRVGSQIESISWMTAEGFSAALGSFVAQNWGAGNVRRAKQGYFTALGIMTVWGCISTAVLVFLAGPIFKLFIPQADVLSMGVDYLVILGYSQLFMCLEIMTTGAFNGFGRTVTPAIINVVLTAARIPAALFLSATALGLNGIWWSISCSSILKGLLLTGVFFWFCKRLPAQRLNKPT